MKIIAFVFLTFFGSTLWLTDFEKARAVARDEHKLILLNFSGSDWCSPCIKMQKEIFSTETFSGYATQNLVLVQADFPRTKKNQLTPGLVRHNEALAEKYNPQGKFPLTLLLDSSGKVIREWTGYTSMKPEEFVTQLAQGTGN